MGGPGQVVGFRPEHRELGNGKPDVLHLEALVEVVEYLGDEQLAHLRLGDAADPGEAAVDEQLEEGLPRQLSVPRSKVLFFDAKTENALGTA